VTNDVIILNITTHEPLPRRDINTTSTNATQPSCLLALLLDGITRPRYDL